jgi:hypothetical protein
LGNIAVARKDIQKKINIKSLTKSLNEYIAKENLEKILGNDEPPRMSLIPKNEEQTIHFSIIFLDDFHKEKVLANNTYYSWEKGNLKLDENNYPLYKYLKKGDLSILKEILK